MIRLIKNGVKESGKIYSPKYYASGELLNEEISGVSGPDISFLPLLAKKPMPPGNWFLLMNVLVAWGERTVRDGITTLKSWEGYQ
jgi:hypothetical protein